LTDLPAEALFTSWSKLAGIDEQVCCRLKMFFILETMGVAEIAL